MDEIADASVRIYMSDAFKGKSASIPEFDKMEESSLHQKAEAILMVPLD